jgi:hypothetical protein
MNYHSLFVDLPYARPSVTVWFMKIEQSVQRNGCTQEMALRLNCSPVEMGREGGFEVLNRVLSSEYHTFQLTVWHHNACLPSAASCEGCVSPVKKCACRHSEPTACIVYFKHNNSYYTYHHRRCSECLVSAVRHGWILLNRFQETCCNSHGWMHHMYSVLEPPSHGDCDPTAKGVCQGYCLLLGNWKWVNSVFITVDLCTFMQDC